MAARKTPPSFPFYAEDYLAGTKKLTLAEKGAYVDCLMHQWHADEGIPADNPKELASIMRCTPAAAKAVWPNIASKFKWIDADGRLRNERMEAEREKKRKYHEAQAANGEKGGRPPKQNPPVSESETDGLLKTKPAGSVPYPYPSDRSGQSAHARGPRRHGDPFGFKAHVNAAALVPLDDTGRVLEIPEGWAKRVRNDRALTHDDIAAFARWLGVELRQAGGVVEDGGNRFRWLDERMAAWRASLTPVSDGYRSASEFDAKLAALDAEIPQRTPERTRELLDQGWRGAKRG